MNIENMEQEFPKMPQSMRDMIEKEVEKQVKITPQKGYFSLKKAVVASLAATFILGTTIFAGTKLYRMSSSPQGNYGRMTAIEKTDGTENTGKTDAQASQLTAQDATQNVAPVAMKLSYLPDGMKETEEGKYSYEQTPGQGGISIVFYQMDTGDESFGMQDDYVTESENIQVGNHDGVYIKKQNTSDQDKAFDQMIYVTYPEYHYVMQMYIGHDVTKEEACKVAEGIVLASAEELSDGTVIHPYNWSDYEATVAEDMKEDSEDGELKTTATADEMKNLHKIGEEFAVQGETGGEAKNLWIKVTDVKVTDDTGILDPAFVDRDMIGTDENGKLIPDTVSYIKSGDGVNTLDEVISSREVPKKLVYVTLEYSNTGDTEMKDILFFNSVMKIKEENGIYEICGAEQPKEGEIWDTVSSDSSSLEYGEEMRYFDVTGGERGNNYFDSIKAGETKTLHVGFVVDEDVLPYLYLNTSTSGCGYEFMEQDLEQGLVDIRQ